MAVVGILDVIILTCMVESKLYKTRKESLEAERKFLEAVSTADITNINITFQAVYEEWLDYKKKKLKSTTLYALRKNLGKNIFDFFKDFKLHSIKINIINSWLE